MLPVTHTSASPPTSPPAPDNNAGPTRPRGLGKIFVDALACVTEVSDHGPAKIEVNDVAAYCAALCGQQPDTAVHSLTSLMRFAAMNAVLPAQAGEKLPIAHCVTLACLYIAVSRDRAFLDDNTFDIAGLHTFICACTGCDGAEVVQMLGEPSEPEQRFGTIMRTPLSNRFTLQPSNGTQLRLGMGKLTTDHTSAEGMNAPWLKNATLVSCTLKELLLSALDLSGLRLENCQLIGMTMIGIDFSKTQWQQVRLLDCRIEACNITQARFQLSRFDSVSFNECDFASSTIHGTCMADTTFVACRFVGATLSGEAPRQYVPYATTVIRSKFQRCIWQENAISRMLFDKTSFHAIARKFPARQNLVEDCAFRESSVDTASQLFAHMQRTSFRHCTVNQADFTSALFRDVEFHTSKLSNVRFDFAHWNGGGLVTCSGLRRASFTRALLSNIEIEGGKFAGVAAFSDLSDADFSVANLCGTTFRQLQFHRAQFTNVNGVDVKWDNCSMRATDFADARFANTVFSGCDLQDVNCVGSAGADWVSGAPNRFVRITPEMGSPIGEPIRFALSRHTVANLGSPSMRARLIGRVDAHVTAVPAQGFMADLADAPASTSTTTFETAPATIRAAAAATAATGMLVRHILGLPTPALRQLAMVSLIDVLNTLMVHGDPVTDADVLLPVLCEEDYISHPVIAAFVEQRIGGMLSGEFMQHTEPHIEIES